MTAGIPALGYVLAGGRDPYHNVSRDLSNYLHDEKRAACMSAPVVGIVIRVARRKAARGATETRRRCAGIAG